jgi:archaemetzincin
VICKIINPVKFFCFGAILIFGLGFAACEKAEINQNASVSEIAAANKNSPAIKNPAKPVPQNLFAAIKTVEPFFVKMGKPTPDEWLATYPESGQTFDEYIKEDPTLPTVERKILYIQPLGKFNPQQRKIINTTAEYMRLFFNLPVKVLPDKAFAPSMSKSSYRFHPQWKTKQILTGYILKDVLQPALPKDAAALIAFTEQDLYPGASMNFVFGQASLENRVGVWSLYRLDNLTGDQNFLKRMLKIAVHETGHIFSIRHCTKYICVMSGANHLGETDAHPIDACPECMAKICWMSDAQPKRRYLNLAEFCKKYGLKAEEESFRKKASAVNQ